jgi:hypothetical protein
LSDPCISMHPSSAYILVYVDDLLLIATGLKLIEKLAFLLSAKYDMRELGYVEWFLGCRVI